MEPITFVTWKWRPNGYRHAFTSEHVNVLFAAVKRNYQGPFRFVTITDDPRGLEQGIEPVPLWNDCSAIPNASGAQLPSCYRRLKLFARNAHELIGAAPSSLAVSLDLDLVITKDLTATLSMPGDFVGWVRRGSHHERVFNGSLWKLRLGSLPRVWEKFDPLTSPREANERGFLGSDQAWMSYQLQGYPGWERRDGILHYGVDAQGHAVLPNDARMVIFCGKKKPWHADILAHYGWVREHWRA
jgi:hypothetical protein